MCPRAQFLLAWSHIRCIGHKSLGDGLMAGMIFAKNILVNWFRVKDFCKKFIVLQTHLPYSTNLIHSAKLLCYIIL